MLISAPVASQVVRRYAAPLAVFVAAFAARFGAVLLSRGGLGGDFGYDPGVYFASSDALVHGRLPYRDFVLLHPPGITLVLTPFALLGRVVGDHVGFMVATVAFQAIGAASAALVTLIARRVGTTWTGALVGGLFYAVWFGALSAEDSTRLEPLSSFAFLLGLWFLVRRPGTRSSYLAAGAALGFAVSVKVWWVVPVVVAVVWAMRQHAGRRGAATASAGAAVALVAVNGPFFAFAPSAMWHMVVLQQLGRPSDTGVVVRADELTGLKYAAPGLQGAALFAVLLVVAVVAVVVAAAACSSDWGRFCTALAVVQLVVLAVSPSYFEHYSDYPAGTFALVVAAAAGRAGAFRIPVAALCAGAVAVTVAAVGTEELVAPLPATHMTAAAAKVHCVMSDTPMALIAMDALSAGLARGCPNWIDVTGRTYGVDAPVSGAQRRRPDNQRWQRDILAYLLSGDAAIAVRGNTGLSPATHHVINTLPVLARSGTWTLHRVP